MLVVTNLLVFLGSNFKSCLLKSMLLTDTFFDHDMPTTVQVIMNRPIGYAV